MTGVSTAPDSAPWGTPGTTASFSALLVQADGVPDDTAAAIALAGGRIVRRTGWADIAAWATQDEADILVLDAQDVPDDRIAATLALLADTEATIVATFAADQIDIVAGGLIGQHAHMLCEPTTGDWLTALFASRGGSGATALREGDSERLARLNAEVARLAELLARFGARDGNTPAGTIGTQGLGFPPPPVTAPPVRAETIRQAIRARRLRDRFFGAGLFEDPAWDMLLDLFAAQIEGIQVSVSSLCIAAAVAPTTALRWIGRLTDAGLLARHADPRDRRRAHMELSPEAGNAMYGYVAALRDAGLPFA